MLIICFIRLKILFELVDVVLMVKLMLMFGKLIGNLNEWKDFIRDRLIDWLIGGLNDWLIDCKFIDLYINW